jgi:asparagine synthase (glutamine-hydrolysing)
VISVTIDHSCCRIEYGALSNSNHSDRSVRLVIVSSASRIDNFAQLARQFGLGPKVCLESLLIAGWQRWGTDLAKHLRGVFAFVLQDIKAKCFYLVRDHFGLAPLFTCEHRGALIIGLSSQSIRAQIPGSLADNELMLADFVAGAYLERAATFFSGIERFPEAHWALINADGEQRCRYWSLSAIPAQPDPYQPVERFRELMDKAVSHCVIPAQTGLMLSGGLDSSAIAASAALLGGPPLATFSLTYHQSQGWCDDRHLAAVAAKTGLDPIEFPSDRHDPLEDMEFWLRAVDGPYLPLGHSVSFRLLKIAQAKGTQVLLSGHGGDEVVSYGFGRLNELATARRWWRLWAETRGAADLYGDSRLRVLRPYLSHIYRLRPIIRWLARGDDAQKPFDHRFLSDAANSALPAKRYNIRSIRNRIDHDERMIHEEALGQALQPCSLEVFALCSAAAGLDTRLPFYNVDLVEYSLSLPSEWKLRHGYSRYILRHAYAGDLPEITLKRRDKYDFYGPFVAGLADQREKVLDLTGPGLADRWGLVNRDSLNAARDRLYRNGTGIERVEAFFLWRIAILAMWAGISQQPLAAPIMKEVI